MSDADPVQVHPDVQNPHQQEEKRRPRRKTSGTRRKTSRGSDIAAVIARLPKPVLAGAVAHDRFDHYHCYLLQRDAESRPQDSGKSSQNLIESYTGGNESKVKKMLW